MVVCLDVFGIVFEGLFDVDCEIFFVLCQDLFIYVVVVVGWLFQVEDVEVGVSFEIGCQWIVCLWQVVDVQVGWFW